MVSQPSVASIDHKEDDNISIEEHIEGMAVSEYKNFVKIAANEISLSLKKLGSNHP